MSISCLFQRQWDSSSRVNAAFFALDLLNSLDYFSSQGELFWCWIAFSTFTYSSRMFYSAFCIDLSCSQFKTNITNKTLQFTQRLRYSDAAVAKGREVQTPNLHVVFVLRQKVCILSKDLQRDCLNWSCILQYMSQFHPLPGFTCMLNKKGNFVQTGYPLLFPVISMCRRCTSAETWITSSYRSGEGFIITSKVFCPKIWLQNE